MPTPSRFPLRTAIAGVAAFAWLAGVVGLGCAVGLAGSDAAQAADELRIVAPSPPGSSWDLIAQAAQKALAEVRPETRTSIANAPGGSGTVGLSQFLADGSDDAILVTGLIMLDATFVHRSPMGLERLTPLARLTSEPFALAVPANSPVRSLAEWRSAFGEDGAKLTWAGGPAAGIDHVATLLFAQALGIEPDRVTYVPFLTSAEAAGAAGQGRVSATILSAGELVDEVRAGRLRVVAVLAPERVDAFDAPILAELGIPLEVSNWRGLVARPGLDAPARERLEELARTIAAAPAWRRFLDEKGWREAFLAGEPFGRFIAAEHARMRATLKGAGLLRPGP